MSLRCILSLVDSQRNFLCIMVVHCLDFPTCKRPVSATHSSADTQISVTTQTLVRHELIYITLLWMRLPSFPDEVDVACMLANQSLIFGMPKLTHALLFFFLSLYFSIIEFYFQPRKEIRCAQCPITYTLRSQSPSKRYVCDKCYSKGVRKTENKKRSKLRIQPPSFRLVDSNQTEYLSESFFVCILLYEISSTCTHHIRHFTY